MSYGKRFMGYAIDTDERVVELIAMDKIYNDILRVFEEKFKNWREEDHEPSKLIMKAVESEDY